MANERKKYSYNKQTVGNMSFYTVTTGPNQGRYFTDYKQAHEYCVTLNAEDEVPAEEKTPADITAGVSPLKEDIDRQLSFEDLMR